MDRPPGIYASTASRRDLARRRARARRGRFREALRSGNWAAVVALGALVVTLVERVAG